MSLASGGLKQFAGKRILLLQGPVGPFFKRLSKKLLQIGATIHKINFNAGDWIFFPDADLNYRQSLEEWPDEFRRIVIELKIDFIFLFGDCRPVHRRVIPIAEELGVRIGVFEEGYVRPHYVTFEEFGVNANSRADFLKGIHSGNDLYIPTPVNFKSTFYLMAIQAFIYFSALNIGWPIFHRYKHHRRSDFFEVYCWIRSIYRKLYYKFKERKIEKRSVIENDGNYFLVPLQNYSDSQISVHSDWKNIGEFIKYVINSFAQHAPPETSIIFKHHPMDRGHRDYSKLILRLAKRENISDRVIYIHDLSLPNLLNHTRGVVLINSSIGISALMRNIPMKVMGRAFYDKDGLCFSQPLDHFWQSSDVFKPDKKFVHSFINNLIYETQINGSFYNEIFNIDIT